MKKIIYIFVLSLSFQVFTLELGLAQFKLKAEAGIALPLRQMGDSVKLGLGGSIATQHFFSERFSLGLQVAYQNFPAKAQLSIDLVSLMGSARYYLRDDKWKPYLGLDFGAYFINEKKEIEPNSSVKLHNFISSGGISPNVGLLYALNARIDLDVNLKYAKSLKEHTYIQFLGVQLGLLYRFGEM